MNDQPKPCPCSALQALRARLVDERHKAERRASLCTIPEARQATVGVAAGISTALYLLDEIARGRDTTPAEEGAVDRRYWNARYDQEGS